jgi:3-hydroxyisobutyrate dehydrogenase-like beta-hydroxyacid dehydrogenase
MAIRAVGVLSPGDMGHAVGLVLHQHGLRVLTCLAGRSERTRALAAEGGFEDAPSLEALVSSVDILLSILVPASAEETAGAVARAVEATHADLLFADCNAIAPSTARRVAQRVAAAGARVADGGIIGPPPVRPGFRLFSSGPGAQELAQLGQFGLDVRVLPGEVGQASGLKMCYAAMTKGTQALATELLVAARAMGLEDALRGEQTGSVAGVRNFVARGLANMPPKAHRWVGEMEEIAQTFEDLGLPGKLMLGAADVYRFVASTPLGHQTPEAVDTSRELDSIIAELADSLPGLAVGRR